MLSKRAYSGQAGATSWEEIWEAGPYYDRISEVLEKADKYAFFVGWQIDSRLPMPIPGISHSKESLKAKILRLCELKPEFHFYFLVWDHPYFYIFEREAWQGRVWDDIHPRVHFVFDSRHPFGGSHHEKVCVIDGQTAFCGGIDLCDDRWDTPEHRYDDPRRSLSLVKENHGPYHDLAVEVRGAIVHSIEEHISSRWKLLSSIPIPETREIPAFEKSEPDCVYLSRTLSQVDPSPTPLIREVEFLFRDLIHSAERQIILEGQYYWSDEVNRLLIAKLEEKAGQDFKIVMILTEMNRFKTLLKLMSTHETRLLRELAQAAERTGAQLVLGYPYVTQPGRKPKPIYVHSKVMIVDDRFLSIGSANFSARALRLDTEINLTLEAKTASARAHIQSVEKYILKHWGIDPSGPSAALSHIYLRPASQEKDQKPIASIFNRIPFRLFFDPKLPYLFTVKRKMVRLMNRRETARIAFSAAYWLTGFALTLGILDFLRQGQEPNNYWSILECAFLFSAWAIPVPVAIASIFITLHEGFRTGAEIVVTSAWVAATWASFSREVFPLTLGSFTEKMGPLGYANAWVKGILPS